ASLSAPLLSLTVMMVVSTGRMFVSVTVTPANGLMRPDVPSSDDGNPVIVGAVVGGAPATKNSIPKVLSTPACSALCIVATFADTVAPGASVPVAFNPDGVTPEGATKKSCSKKLTVSGANGGLVPSNAVIPWKWA